MDTDADILTPVVTPFDGERVDTDALADLVAHLVDAGLDGIVPCGTTGEFAALSESEYATVVETTVENASECTVIAGAGGTAVADVRERIETVARLGADAALVVAPYYDAAPAPAGNERFFEAALADAPIPAYLYNIPGVAGQAIDVDTVVSLAERDLVSGIKDSSGDLRYHGELLRRVGDELTVYQGYDAGFVASLVLGADGGVNAVAQVEPGAFADAASAVETGDVAGARAAQLERIEPTFECCIDHGAAAVIKAILADRGTIPSPDVRPPLLEPSAEARQRIAQFS